MNKSFTYYVYKGISIYRFISCITYILEKLYFSLACNYLEQQKFLMQICMYMRENKESRVRKRPFSSSIKGRATNASHAQSSYRRCLVHVTLRFGGGKLRSSFDSMITSSYLNLAPVVLSHTYIVIVVSRIIKLPLVQNILVVYI